MTKITILLAAFILTFATGCATQKVEKTDKDGNRTRYKTTALFNKTAFQGIQVDKTTKTTSALLGVGSYGAESQGEALAQFLEGITKVFQAGASLGVKGVLP